MPPRRRLLSTLEFNKKHPRDRRGRFTASGTRPLTGGDRDRAQGIMAVFTPKRGLSARPAGHAYLQGVADRGPARTPVVDGYFGGGHVEAHQALRAGNEDRPDVAAMDAAMGELPDDIIVSRRVPADMFGNVAPDSLVGAVVRDAAYAPTSLGTVRGHPTDVRMRIAVPAGTRAIVNPDTGEVVLDRDLELAVTRVEVNSQGGHDMYLVVLPNAQSRSAPKSVPAKEAPVKQVAAKEVPAKNAQVKNTAKKATPAKNATPRKRAAPPAPATAKPAGPEPVRGRDVTQDKTLLGEAVRAAADHQDHADPVMGGLASKIGFDGPAERASQDRMREEIDRGGIEIWRGVKPKIAYGHVVKTADSMVANYRSGPMWYGFGTGANGVYGSTRQQTAVRYAGSNNGAYLRIVLRADARTISHRDLRERYRTYGLPLALSDPGRFAMALGYDAIVADVHDPSTGKPNGEKYVVILNRTATLVDAS